MSLLGIFCDQSATLRACLDESRRSRLSQSGLDARRWYLSLFADTNVLVARFAEQSRDALSGNLDSRAYLQRDSYTFAHEGTIEDVELLRRRTSQTRVLQTGAATDGANLFAYVLTCIDVATDLDTAVTAATSQIENCGARGTFTFVLSNGNVLYAYRLGRPLSMLVRPNAVLVASEAATDEAWTPLADGVLLVAERRAATVACRFLRNRGVEASEPELPFTD